jgi:hypothetical protein
MVEISLSGSGGGSGWATAPGYPTGPRPAIRSNPFLLEQLLGVHHERGILVAATASSWSFDTERVDQEEPIALGPEAAAQARLATLSSAERELLGRAVAMGSVSWAGGVVALGHIGADPWDPTMVLAPDLSIEETKRLLVSLQERGLLGQVSAQPWMRQKKNLVLVVMPCPQ